MTIITPIHTATVAGKPVRFFAGASGRPEMPWHAADDLFVACGFTRPMRRHFARMQQRIFGADIRTVATHDGPIVLAPHVAAQGLLNAGAEVGEKLPRGIDDEYAQGAADTLGICAGDRHAEDLIDFLCEAARNSGIGG